MSLDDIDEYLEQAEEDLNDFQVTVNRRTDIFRGYARNSVSEERYLEELERTEDVAEELEEVSGDLEEVYSSVYDEELAPEELRGDVMELKGLYDGLLNRLKEAEHTAASIERDEGRDFTPAYRLADDSEF